MVRRGFNSMDAERARQIASKGGKAAHAKGKAHKFTSEEAKVAGRKGGLAVSKNRQHMSEIGRRGGYSVAKIPGHMSQIGKIGGNSTRDGDKRVPGVHSEVVFASGSASSSHGAELRDVLVSGE